jgi:hypothetical protein
LRKIASRGDTEPRAERLQQNRHQVGEQRNGEQRVPELGAAGERRRPVARIHVSDRDQIAGAEEGYELLAERAGGSRRDGAEHLGERRSRALAPPAGWFSNRSRL